MIKNQFRTPISSKGDFENIPEDIYHCVIEDVNLEERQVYQSQDVEEVLNFKFTILEEGDFLGQKVWKKIRPILNAGWDGGSPSDLYELWKSAMKVLPNIQQLEMGLSGDEINSLIGEQLRVTVKIKTSAKGKEYNKIEGFMSAKSKLPAPKLKSKEAGEIKKLEAKKEVEDEAPTDDDSYADENEDVNAQLDMASQKIKEKDLPF